MTKLAQRPLTAPSQMMQNQGQSSGLVHFHTRGITSPTPLKSPGIKPGTEEATQQMEQAKTPLSFFF